MKDKPKEILMILQPRAIPEAIDSLNKLDIEKVWFRGYTEMELETVLNDFIKNTDYDYYWIISDDVVVDNKPLEVLRSKLYEGEVVTGYCKLHQASELVNICENMWEYGLPIEKVYQLHAQILTQGIHHLLRRNIMKNTENIMMGRMKIKISSIGNIEFNTSILMKIRS